MLFGEFKLPGLPSVDQIVNQNPIAQAFGKAGASLMGVGDKPGVDDKTYYDLVHYFKYASTAYALILPGPDLIKLRPNGQTLCKKLFDLLTDSHGYIARDDTKKEIVIAYRGSVSPTNFVIDFISNLVDWNPKRVPAPSAGCQVHNGFQIAWETLADATLAGVDEQLKDPRYAGYTIVATGHSLGAAMASIAAITIKEKYPNNVKLYTYGQPRTGNAVYAQWINDKIGKDNCFRVVNNLDGVPTMIPQMVGYMHHGTEYWSLLPHSPATTKKCDTEYPKEDPHGSNKFPSTGINPPHLEYFDIPYITPFLSLF